MFIFDHLKNMPYDKKKNIRKYIRKIIKCLPSFFNMKTLALINGTDKLAHGYIPYYQNHFKALRNHQLKILEIGVGGYSDPHVGGESLRLWSDYFRKSIIYGIDINDKSPHIEKRIKIFTGSQNDPKFLKDFAEQTGPFDIIIDDGSHINEHIINSFSILFDYLKNEGIYVIEDIHTSYWPQFLGWKEKKAGQTSIEFLKSLVESIHSEFIPNHVKAKYDRKIKSISFYQKIVFIQKGLIQNIKLPYIEYEIKRAEKLVF